MAMLRSFGVRMTEDGAGQRGIASDTQTFEQSSNCSEGQN